MNFNEMFDAACASEKVHHAQVVACLAKRGRPVAYGVNQKKSHPFQKRFGKMEECITLHSEVDVIKNALKTCTVKELEKMDLYVMRAKRSGKGKPFIPGLAMPCKGCMKAIVTFSINRVYYSTDNSYEWNCLDQGWCNW